MNVHCILASFLLLLKLFKHLYFSLITAVFSTGGRDGNIMIWDTRCIKKGSLLFWPPTLNNRAVKMFYKANQNVFIHHRWFLQASKTDQWCPYETWKIYTSNKEETWDGAPCGESCDLTIICSVFGYWVCYSHYILWEYSEYFSLNIIQWKFHFC